MLAFSCFLLSQVEFSNDRTIPVDLLFLQVIKQVTSFTNQPDQGPAGAVVFLIFFQMFGQMIDPESEQCHLAFRASCILFVLPVLSKNLFLLFSNIFSSFIIQFIDFFLNDQQPRSWNAFAEVVWKDKKTPQFIGDIPHTWVGSDFINAIRTLFVYENEYDQSLVIASALYQDWIDSPEGMSVENLPTYYGEISYSIKKVSDNYHFSITGDVKLPANGIKIKNFNGSKLPKKVTVNGNEIKEYNEKEISTKEMPAEIMIYY